ncbi:hypothetical protein [Kutzneria buriramensis]|uniref:Effector-associated domain-containing protein n=1 Tax=Kutzneria buriramensis TaxID=1045776 RepID=A0A3E0H2S7_9PSEU|nr:hypothetical protein [Kutzneria buriramensis]REH36330.1 hypothetical protein BCF44_116199 [Kutzneria buriramensis]
MDIASAAVHHTIVAVDVEKYSSADRTDFDRLAVRDGMYEVVSAAFRESDIPWERCQVGDVGDSLLVLLPADVPKVLTVDRLPHRLTAMLRRHNQTHAAGAQMRLRMAVHAGEVHHDRHGTAGESVIHACRLLDAEELRAALAGAAEELALIISDGFYLGTVRHDPALSPASFRRITVSVKETEAYAWLRAGGPAPAAPQPAAASRPTPMALAELSLFVDILADIPQLSTQEGRDHMLSLLPREMWTGIRRQQTPWTDLASIVAACGRFPDGLHRLAEAVGFVAGGTHAATALDRLVNGVDIAHGPGGHPATMTPSWSRELPAVTPPAMGDSPG